jgi:hypothetical protein
MATSKASQTATTKRKTSTKKRGPTETSLAATAADIARDMHENDFPSRRGIGPFEVGGRVVGFYLYDNNPFANDPERRPANMAKLVAFLAQRGCRLVASASYPAGEIETLTLREGRVHLSTVSFPEGGYTTAQIFVSDGDPTADEVAARDRIQAILAGRHLRLVPKPAE